jgi:WD repeat-containing protein 35
LFIVHNLIAEDGIICSGYIARIWDLQVRVVALDHLMTHAGSFDRSTVIDLPTARLRTVTDIIHTRGVEAAVTHVAGDPHPQLWRVIGENALEQLNLAVAERAFVELEDYASVKFVQQLKQMNDQTKQRAEVASFLGRAEVAESIYREIDRKDLAIEVRGRMGDWFRVDQLLRAGGNQGRR